MAKFFPTLRYCTFNISILTAKVTLIYSKIRLQNTKSGSTAQILAPIADVKVYESIPLTDKLNCRFCNVLSICLGYGIPIYSSLPNICSLNISSPNGSSPTGSLSNESSSNGRPSSDTNSVHSDVIDTRSYCLVAAQGYGFVPISMGRFFHIDTKQS